MENTLDILFSPVWLITGFVAGIIASIIASYFRDGIDKILSKFSTWWAARTETKKAVMDKRALEIFDNEYLRFKLFKDDIRYRLLVIKWVLVVVLITGALSTVTILKMSLALSNITNTEIRAFIQTSIIFFDIAYYIMLILLVSVLFAAKNSLSKFLEMAALSDRVDNLFEADMNKKPPEGG